MWHASFTIFYFLFFARLPFLWIHSGPNVVRCACVHTIYCDCTVHNLLTVTDHHFRYQKNFGCVQQSRRRINWMRAHIKNVFINEQQPKFRATDEEKKKWNWKYINFERNKKKKTPKANNKFNAFHGAIHTTTEICAPKSEKHENLSRTKYAKRKRFVYYRRVYLRIWMRAVSGPDLQLLRARSIWLMAGELECVS